MFVVQVRFQANAPELTRSLARSLARSLTVKTLWASHHALLLLLGRRRWWLRLDGLQSQQ